MSLSDAVFSFIYSPLQILECSAVLYSLSTGMALALFHATAGEMPSHDNSVSSAVCGASLGSLKVKQTHYSAEYAR